MVRCIQALNYRCLRHVDVRLDGNFHIGFFGRARGGREDGHRAYLMLSYGAGIDVPSWSVSETVSVGRCVDLAFNEFRSTLRRWFPRPEAMDGSRRKSVM